MRKSLRVQVRVSEELRERLDHAEKTGKIKESVFFVELLEAYCDYVEASGQSSFPLSVIPKKELAALQDPAPAKPVGQRRVTRRILGRVLAKASS